MSIVYLFISLVILFLFKVINFSHIEKSFYMRDCLKSITSFRSVKYYVNYSKKEQKYVRWNNWLNGLILANTLLLVVLGFMYL